MSPVSPLEWACFIVATGQLAFLALLDRLLRVERCNVGPCWRCSRAAWWAR